MVHINCGATLGVVGNEQHQNMKVGKAGRVRAKGRRPQVRGIVMNACRSPARWWRWWLARCWPRPTHTMGPENTGIQDPQAIQAK
ncbi:MAG: hypothetical protein U5L95_00765 [Candidatus Saccharibacteria bacterium]|nr:hypothetical protein [Candidatus Saccharibacteria bacterium]